MFCSGGGGGGIFRLFLNEKQFIRLTFLPRSLARSITKVIWTLAGPKSQIQSKSPHHSLFPNIYWHFQLLFTGHMIHIDCWGNRFGLALRLLIILLVLQAVQGRLIDPRQARLFKVFSVQDHGCQGFGSTEDDGHAVAVEAGGNELTSRPIAPDTKLAQQIRRCCCGGWCGGRR